MEHRKKYIKNLGHITLKEKSLVKTLNFSTKGTVE